MTVSNDLHPSVYIAIWIICSGSVILFNKYILHTLEFPFPILLTTFHLLFATIATRIMRRTTSLLNGLDAVKITPTVYRTAILPSASCFQCPLLSQTMHIFTICGIWTDAEVLLIGYLMQIEKPDSKILMKVSLIVIGTVLTSYGEVQFVVIGVLCQVTGILTEATRLVLVQKLLKDFKMDPLVSLYHFAPICALMNGIARISTALFELLDGAIAQRISSVLDWQDVITCMCLSGIFKNILLVSVSVLIWGTPISSLQFLGYGIALIGLVSYKQPDIESRWLAAAFVHCWQWLVGAATALALHQVGIESSLYDQVDLVDATLKSGGSPIVVDFGDSGGSVMLGASALRVVNTLGLLDQVMIASYPSPTTNWFKIDGSSQITLDAVKVAKYCDETEPAFQTPVQILRSKMAWTFKISEELGAVQVMTFNDPLPSLVRNTAKYRNDDAKVISNFSSCNLRFARSSIYHKGRVVLLGDSAHGMVPNAGVGLMMGLEDVGTLLELFRHYQDPQYLPRVFELYSKLRVPRGTGLRCEAVRWQSSTIQALRFGHFKLRYGTIYDCPIEVASAIQASEKQ
ncbi:hypothetical protein BCR33DRAFT_849780 [Rhizoclosmatium globosum]|uniref:FAD-binding domain-containing protein n=1 Tax=Rhizoclosmatium globosum TaxID=329046 RepID=A0A1Y2CEM7_9FUNG|nr:hypothetical protein BCR33DRAFT_849780 [Rhizoclosmatium globosum]|eukprot:ORY45503.1 hypothetical protein BCR33DRAFT_849780 [Rhizoclosmatium globosum]